MLRSIRSAPLVAVLALLGCGADPKPQLGPIELKETTAKDLDRAIADKKGKVVLIDIWFLGCAPCVKKFPSFVELHRKYAGEGLVCMSVNVYQEELKEKPAVLDFLKKQGADFPNYIFKDDAKSQDAWQEKNDALPTPCYVAFDRKGNRKSVPFPAKEKEIEDFIKKLLDEK